MKKTNKKKIEKNKVKKLSAHQKKGADKKSGSKKVEEPVIMHTAGAEMPDPSAHYGSSRKDAREAFH